jgi:hypothetical protein
MRPTQICVEFRRAEALLWSMQEFNRKERLIVAEYAAMLRFSAGIVSLAEAGIDLQ